MNSDIPEFKSPFLDHISRQFKKRRKALSYFAKLRFVTRQPDEFDWLTVVCQTLGGHYVVFQFVEDNRINLYVRSSRRRDRGKILFRKEDFHVIDNSELIVNAVEHTLRMGRDCEGSDCTERFISIWKNVLLGVAEERNER